MQKNARKILAEPWVFTRWANHSTRPHRCGAFRARLRKKIRFFIRWVGNIGVDVSGNPSTSIL